MTILGFFILLAVAACLCWLISKYIAPPTLRNVLVAVVVILTVLAVCSAVFGWSAGSVLNSRIGK